MRDQNDTSNSPTLLGSAGSTVGVINEKGNKKLIIAFIMGLIVGGGSVWMWIGRSADIGDVSTAGDEEVLNGDEGLANVLSSGEDISKESGNAILVRNQLPGDSVSIDSAVLSEIGWVAIHEDRNGVPGNILGATLFNVGRNRGIVELLRPTVEGGTYYAMLHDEAGRGENGFTFDHETDLPIIDSSGNPIMIRFNAVSNQLPVVQ
jgi:hypothetical protein